MCSRSLVDPTKQLPLSPVDFLSAKRGTQKSFPQPRLPSRNTKLFSPTGEPHETPRRRRQGGMESAKVESSESSVSVPSLTMSPTLTDMCVTARSRGRDKHSFQWLYVCLVHGTEASNLPCRTGEGNPFRANILNLFWALMYI